MIYILVNNNYHRIEIEEYIEQLKEIDEVGLIQIPHTLDLKQTNGFKKTYTIFPIMNKTYLKLGKVRAKIQEIRSKIPLQKNDILIIFTEYEILNHLVVDLFKKKGLKVYLLEEGLATYLESCYEPKDKISLKRRVFYLYLKFILGLKNMRLLRSNTMSPFIIEDKQIDKIFTFLNIKTYRNIEQEVLNKSLDLIPKLDKNRVIFLNEDIYNFFTDYDTYIVDLSIILERLSEKFSEVIFKFHPREYKTPNIIADITKKIEKISNVIILNEQEPIEILANRIRAKYVVSYMSLALMNLYYRGMEPIYIYTLLDSIKHEKDFQMTTRFLNDLGYNFINDFETINSDYKSNLRIINTESKTLKEALFNELRKETK